MTARPVVVATDGSGESVRAVEWAAREAALCRVPLRIVSAASLPKMVVLQLQPERDAAETIRSGTRQTAASLAAHSTARTDSPEPSVATTTGFAVIADPPHRTWVRRGTPV